jgi:hypothetical protein
MSGYLRRLARRTLGTEVPVHSAAAVPFGEPPAVVALDLASDAEVPVVRSRVAQAAMDATQHLPRAERVFAAETLPFRGKSPDHRPLEMRRLLPTTGPEHRVPVASTPKSDTTQLPMVDPRKPAMHPPVAPVVVRDKGFRPELALPTRHVTSAPDVTPASARAHAAPRPSAPFGMRDGEFERRSAPAREPSEVHVHIGRIEVTAVPAAPATKRPPREQPKPMTLSQYLTRRRGKGR